MRALQRLWILHKQPQFRKSPKYWFHSAMHDAATIANVEALEWLFDTTGEKCEPSSVSLAAMGGHADVVRWQLGHLPDFDLESAQRAMIKAATNGRLDVLKAFHEWRKDACTSQMMDLAAAGGHLAVVQFLHEHGEAGCSTDAVDCAAENGHLDVVKWLLANRDEGFTQAGLRGAVANGHVDVVQYVWNEHRSDDATEDQVTTTLTRAIRSGVPDAIRKKDGAMLRYLYSAVGDNAFPRYALSLAAQARSNLDLFSFLHSTSRPREDVDEALEHAIFNAGLLQFLLKHDVVSTSVLTKALNLAEGAQQNNDAFQPAVMALVVAIAQQHLDWQWRHNTDGGVQQWSSATAATYLNGALRGTARGLIDKLPRDPRLRDPRRQLLREVAKVFEDSELQSPPASATPPSAARGTVAACEGSVLFFDGGSRGNPGPGGAGAVLVAMDLDATTPRVIWSACMSYQRDDMTNNQAEYLGVIAGLREAQTRGLRPEVVGDSSLILRQLQLYRPPRSAKLRPLYSEARRLADIVQVEVWQHHLRAYNKMADAAANVAMDSRTSVQVSHPSARPHTSIIDDLLQSDFQEWHTRHLLRTTRD